MKFFAVTLLLIPGIFLIADEARVAVVHQFAGSKPEEWFFGAGVILQATFGYIAPFFTAGIATAWLVPPSRSAPWVALLFGLAVVLSGLISGAPQPFAFSTHGPEWFNVAGWTNWFGPPIAAMLGALLAKHLRPNLSFKRTPDGAA